MEAPVVIRISHVTKTFPCYSNLTGGIKTFLFNLRQSVNQLRQRSLALENISFEIHKGEAFGLVGVNGAGKSTLLGLMAGVLFPNQGSVEVHGRISPLLELGAGFHPDLTGRENILLNGTLLGLRRDEIKNREQQIIEFSTLGHFIDQPVRTYSSGMYAKLGFSVVACLKPEIMLLDEIFSVGDLSFTNRCTERMAAFRKDPNVTMVLVSHGLSTITNICDRAAWIENHHLRMIGPAEEVVDAYKSSVTASVPVHGKELNPIPQILTPSREELRLVNGEEALRIGTSSPALGMTLEIGLCSLESNKRIREWHCAIHEQTVMLEFMADTDIHVSINDKALENVLNFQNIFQDETTEATGQNIRPLDKSSPMYLELCLRDAHGILLPPPIFLPVGLTLEGCKGYERQRAHAFGLAQRIVQPDRLLAPLWIKTRTVHIVSRNIFLDDAVGRFTLDVAGLLLAAGVNVRVYAYVYPPELAGTVLPLGRLFVGTVPHDILFYNYSIYDEFLSQVVDLPCKKVLYYHNVTPHKYFEHYDAGFAKVLEHSREQFKNFVRFKSVLANSQFSLDELQPFLDKGAQQWVHPPMLSPTGLENTDTTEILPKRIQGPFILWVGRIAPHKQPEVALQIFAAVAKQLPCYSFVFVGNGYHDFPLYTSELDKSRNSFPEDIQQRILFFEHLSLPQMRNLFELTSGLLCTSKHEGFGMPLYEAMRFGKPIFYTQSLGVEETLAGIGYALPEEPEAAAKKIAACLSQPAPEILAALTKRGQQLFDLATGAAIWEALEAASKPRTKAEMAAESIKMTGGENP